MAHAEDLQLEGIDATVVAQIRTDHRSAQVTDAEHAMLAYAEKLTRTPDQMGGEDVERLRAAGWNDRAISDIVQVTAYFNYINRVAEGVGVDLEPEWSR